MLLAQGKLQEALDADREGLKIRQTLAERDNSNSDWQRDLSRGYENVGDVLVALGLLVIFFVFKENSYAAATVQVYGGQEVVSSGPYRIVRHPMYSGALLMMFGIPLALGSLWGLLFWLGLAAALVWRLVEEEKYLSANLAGYAAYCAKTRYRLIPGVY